MGRITFLCPYPPEQISGGIKTCYQHAELLNELGADACVFQPGGPPSWFTSKARVITEPQAMPAADDILVFPEALTGWLADMARMQMPARKFLFCQNQYIAANTGIPAAQFASLGFDKVICSSDIAAGFLRRVMQLSDAMTVPCFVDGAIFRPMPKTMQIALSPRKMPDEAGFIRLIFDQKYPHLRSIPWVSIHEATEPMAADILGRSTIFLSLSHRESLGLMPLEAMASGCAVVGFHGYGGMEYATAENGYWLRPDFLEETADTLALVVDAMQTGGSKIAHMIKAGTTTAAGFSRARTRDALKSAYLRAI